MIHTKNETVATFYRDTKITLMSKMKALKNFCREFQPFYVYCFKSSATAAMRVFFENNL